MKMSIRMNEPQIRKGRKTGSLLGFVAAGLSAFGKSLPKPGTSDLKKADFCASTQRMGIRFTERIRSVFRFRWLKKL